MEGKHMETPSRLTEPDEVEECDECESPFYNCECDWEGRAADMAYDAMKDER
jgi:hypothetical protein